MNFLEIIICQILLSWKFISLNFQEHINLVNYWRQVLRSIFIGSHSVTFFTGELNWLRVQENCLGHPSRVYQPGRFRWVLIDCVARLRCELLLTLVVQLERFAASAEWEAQES